MTYEELLNIFAARYSAAQLASVLDMLNALLAVEIANAQASIAQAGASAAMSQAETVRQQAQAEANAAKEAFAALVAQAAQGG